MNKIEMTDVSKRTTVSCAIRQPIAINLNEETSASSLKTGLFVIEVKFPNVLRAQVGEIHFKNYYTASLVVKMKERGSMLETVESKWKTVVRRMPLMPRPHCETGSQDYFTIKRKQMLCDMENIVGLRFILYQPSPVWREFRIEQLQLYSPTYNNTNMASLPSWLTSEAQGENTQTDKDVYKTALKNRPSKANVNAAIPNIESVTNSIQQIWALAEKVKDKAGKTPLRRYDVDGSYEINLLSYT